ncbi:MAG: 4'-phosphopantetheinyl transferase superfamily protein [Fermentimonas sp.]|nr:4'-phosphopantetheinyl transferase superfamily protein [Fermentimonas sp.]
MLVRKEYFNNGGLMGIWKMDESIHELINLFPPEAKVDAEKSINNIGSNRRTLELLTTRILLLELLGRATVILNQDDGKPYLDDNSNHISISHTKGYVAILLHKSCYVGIDIETISNRVENIAHRFISDKEYINLEQKIIHLLLHWSTKECLYKILNEQGVDFKKQLYVTPFEPSSSGIIEAQESKTHAKQTFELNYEVHPTYVLTWVIDTKNAPELPERS